MTKKILIVDDDQKELKTMQEILEKEGYETITAEDGAKALDSLTEDQLSLIIIDIKMPTLSGYDLLRLLREKLNQKTPMMYATIVPKKDVDLEEIDGFIQKPFSAEQFLEEVNKTIK